MISKETSAGIPNRNFRRNPIEIVEETPELISEVTPVGFLEEFSQENPDGSPEGITLDLSGKISEKKSGVIWIY